MIYKSVAEIFDFIDKTRADLISKTQNLDEEQKNLRAAQTGWSVAEIVEHLATVENGMIKISAKLLAEAEGEGSQSDGSINPPISFVEFGKAMQNQKFEAPERVRPKGTQNLTESLAKMQENRLLLQQLRPRFEAADATKPTFPHPALGELNSYQWLAMIGIHEQRHLAQIEKILDVNVS